MIADLSPRQRDVAELLVAGAPNKVIAARLGLQEPSVKVYLTGLMAKLEARNRTDAAVTLALAWGGRTPPWRREAAE